MTNRQKLIETNIYDVLCDINEELLSANCHSMCVIEALKKDYECDYCNKCDECIAKWLNEEMR